ncbi:YcxB family protein [Streptomyces sp. NPDC101393]|uniref:YcxB family protein n=1 Tax=Streptomyces sp. NPDC101393 TaxID=3366141 RepID=UPI0038037246
MARIELSCTPTVEDFREALRVRAKASKSARRTRWLLAGTAGCLAVGLGLSWTTQGTVDPPLVVMPLALVLLLVGQARLQARAFHRLAASKGEQRIIADESGVTVTTEQTSTSLTWQAAPRYAETPRLFVLLSGDKNASSMTLLPKRGAGGEADVDRLRGLLEQHLAPIGSKRDRAYA